MIYFPKATIILSASKTKLGRLIRWGQRTWREAPSKVNHSIMTVEGGWWPGSAALRLDVCDAEPGESPEAFTERTGEKLGMVTFLPEPIITESDALVRTGPLSKWHASDKIVAFSIEMTEEERELVAADAGHHQGRPYATLQLFGQLIDNKLLFGRNIFRRLAKFDPLDICSVLTGRAFARCGITFGEAAYAQSPDDQDDFLRRAAKRGGMFDLLGNWRKVTILHDDFTKEGR